MALDVVLIEPYYGGSHRAWADGFARNSSHRVSLLTLPAEFWKWRMQGGAISLSKQYLELGRQADVILASDMMDLTIFRALTHTPTPIALYFHENQLTYPQNLRQRHGWQYGFINYASALAANAVFFNSAYHLEVFFDELPRMLKHFGAFDALATIDDLWEKSSVLPLGLSLARYDDYRLDHEDEAAAPLILWNHRWEAEKNPQAFFNALYALLERDIDFRVALVGENLRQQPHEFEAAREKLGSRVVRYGFVENFAEYAGLLWEADYVVSTAYQDFFGSAIAEAMYCGCIPLLPKRLNYPALVPEQYHAQCLFRGNNLLPLLSRHLTARAGVDLQALRLHSEQFDWRYLIAQYDDALSLLAQASPYAPEN